MRFDRIVAIAALTLLSAHPAHAQAKDASEPSQVVVTTGEGVVRRAPDRAWVTIAAESHAQTPQDAQRANADAMAAVIAKIKDAGIPAEAIQTTGVNLQPEYDYANGHQTLRDYVARNEVQVRVDTLASLGGVIAAAVGGGATNVSGVRFDLQNRDAIERDALRRAVADARARADAAAAGASLRVDRVVRIEEERIASGPQPVVRGVMAMQRADAAQPAVPVEAGEIEVRARVTLTASLR